jgi:hypothetical protein
MFKDNYDYESVRSELLNKFQNQVYDWYHEATLKVINEIESTRILDALHSASCAQVVYDALKQVPIDNLHDMFHMIEHILSESINEKMV